MLNGNSNLMSDKFVVIHLPDDKNPLVNVLCSHSQRMFLSLMWVECKMLLRIVLWRYIPVAQQILIPWRLTYWSPAWFMDSLQGSSAKRSIDKERKRERWRSCLPLNYVIIRQSSRLFRTRRWKQCSFLLSTTDHCFSSFFAHHGHSHKPTVSLIQLPRMLNISAEYEYVHQKRKELTSALRPRKSWMLSTAASSHIDLSFCGWTRTMVRSNLRNPAHHSVQQAFHPSRIRIHTRWRCIYTIQLVSHCRRFQEGNSSPQPFSIRDRPTILC